MIKAKLLKYFGGISIFSGFFSLISSVSITGFAVFEEIDQGTRSTIGILLIILGVILVWIGNEKEKEKF